MPAPFLPRRTQIALKIEAVEGTDVIPAAADLIHPAYDVEWELASESNERNAAQASFSQEAQVPGERSVTIRFKTELKGSGSLGVAPPNLLAALSCCCAVTENAAVDVDIDPATASVSSCTIDIREGDATTVFKSKKALGCRGTFRITADKGGLHFVEFEFTGAYPGKPTDTVAFTPTPVSTPLPVAFKNQNVVFHGTNIKISSYTFDIGNEVVLRNDPGAIHGNLSAVIVGRTPRLTLDPEQEDVATMDFFDRLDAGTEGTFALTIGTVSTNIVAITVAKLQIIGLGEGDRDAIRTEEIECQMNKNAVGGDDEWNINIT